MKTKSILMALAMALCVVTSVNAQKSEQTQENQAVTVATVNIYNAALVNQSENGELSIAFELNNREGIQSNIKYAVNLIQQTKDKSILMDQQVYDEQVTLGQGETKQKKIIYAPPYFLGGTYQLMIEARNTDGLTLGLADAGSVLLSGNGQNVIIYQDSCYLTIEGDKENKHYTLSQGVNIKPEENISLNCEIENKVAGDIIVTPTFTTYYYSIFGKKIEQKTTELFSLKKGEKITKSFAIPKQKDPQVYETVFTLNDDSSNPISEKITVRYVIAGQSANIQNVQFDKSSYQKDEKVKLSLFYSATSSNPADSKTEQDALNVEIDIKDQDNKACAPIFKKELGTESFNTFEIPLTQNCVNPSAEVSIKNKDGKLLAQNSFGTSEKTPKPTTSVAESINDWGLGAKAALLGAAVLAIIVLIAVFAKKRKGKTLIWLFAFVLAGLAMGEGVKADSFNLNSQCNTSSWIPFSVNNGNNSSFTPGQPMTVAISIGYTGAGTPSSSVNVKVNGVSKEYYAYHEIVKHGCDIFGNNCHSGYTGSSQSFNAESTAGSYNVSVFGEYLYAGCANGTSTYHNDVNAYTVTAPAVVVNGSCGTANGGSFSAAPTSGLCSAGTASAVTGSWSWTCTGSGTGHTDASCSANKITTCTVSSWSPATDTVCSGTVFEQTSNCPNVKRQATGTKSCSCNPSCPTTCGGGGEDNGCSGTCAARAACPPTCTCPDPSLYCQGVGLIGSCNQTCPAGTKPGCIAPTLDFTASPADIPNGGSTTLSWSTTNATYCRGYVGGGIGGFYYDPLNNGGWFSGWPSQKSVGPASFEAKNIKFDTSGKITYNMDCFSDVVTGLSVSKSVTVNKGCDPATSFSCSYNPPLNDQICDGKNRLVNVNPSCSCTSLCGGSCPSNVTLGDCNSNGKKCSPKVINCSGNGNRNLPGGYEEVAP
jgi:hypothetical protein